MPKILRSRVKWTEEEVRAVHALRKARVPVKKICKMLGVTQRSYDKQFGHLDGETQRRVTVTANEIRLAETMAGYGISDNQIMKVIGCSLRTLKEACGDRLEVARVKAGASVAGKLYERAMSGNMEAIKFFLKNMLPEQFSDKLQVDVSGDAGVLVAPGAVDMDVWLAEEKARGGLVTADGTDTYKIERRRQIDKAVEGKSLPWEGDGEVIDVNFDPGSLEGRDHNDDWSDSDQIIYDEDEQELLAEFEAVKDER